ncbi:hypothetical protein KKH81_00005, partial [Patescibacteria group bacterium]|nr:hypothetical protein [Patescibacteria group bacterium]
EALANRMQAQHAEATALPPDTADTVNFGFDAEENGDLKIKSSSNDPESSILIADENNESEEYTVFVFDLDNQDQADSLVTDITVGITSSTDGDDFIRRATLVVDGDEYDGDINADTIEFTDLDTEIAGDDRVEVELMITLVSDAPSATATFTIAGADIDAEGVDSGDDANVTGSQSSETHTVALTGVAVEAGSTSISSNDTETVGTFRIEFEITALEDDQYIFKGADNASSSTSGVIYTIYAGNTATTSFYGTASDLLQSTADDSDNGDYYVIQSGDTETFTLTVTLDPTATGLYFVELNAVRYDPDNAEDTSAIDDDTYTVPNDADFQTSAQSLQAGS